MIRVVLILALAAASLTAAQTPDEKKATLAYLAALRTEGGGYRLDAKAKAPTLRATSAALRATRYFGGTAPFLDDTRKFVEKCRVKGGGFANTPGGTPDVILTSVGLMASIETGLLTAKSEKAGPSIAFMEENAKAFEEVRMLAAGAEAVSLKPRKATDWLKSLAKTKNEDGTWGEGQGQARDTGGHAAAVLRLGGKVKGDAVLKALDEGQRKDGGFGKADAEGSDLETTYRVLRTYHMLKKKPAKADGVRGFVAKCRNKDGGYGIAPGAPSGVGPTYFAGIILHWLGGK